MKVKVNQITDPSIILFGSYKILTFCEHCNSDNFLFTLPKEIILKTNQSFNKSIKLFEKSV